VKEVLDEFGELLTGTLICNQQKSSSTLPELSANVDANAVSDREVLGSSKVDDTDAANLNPTAILPFSTIPDNIVCHVPLAVRASSIEGAGRGIFVERDVAAHDIILMVKTPRLSIVSDQVLLFGFLSILLGLSMKFQVDGELNSLETVCDNSLGLSGRKSDTVSIRTTADPKFQVTPCGGCKIYHYCGKVTFPRQSCRCLASQQQKCQKKAWTNHHKYECQTLVKMVATGEEKKLTSLLKSARVRCLIRVLQLHVNKILSEQTWTEI
jgi:hypothetical protein